MRAPVQRSRHVGPRRRRRPPHASWPRRRCPGRAWTRRVLVGLRGDPPRSRPAQPGAAGPARRLQADIDAWHRDQRGLPHDPAAYAAFLARDRLPAAGARRRPGRPPRTWTRRSPGSPARSSSCRSPTPATRSTPPMPAGAASTTRSTAPTRSRRTATSPRAPGFNPARGAAVVARTRAFLDAVAPLSVGTWSDAVGFSVAGGRLAVDLGAGRSAGPTGAAAFGGYHGRRRGTLRAAAAPQRPARRDRHRPGEPDRSHRPRRHRRRGAGIRPLDHHGHGGFRRRRGFGRQGRGLPQLARPDARRPRRHPAQGGPHRRAAPRRGPDLHGPRRRKPDPAGPGADAGPARRPSHVHGRRDPRRPRDPRDAPRRGGDRADRPARPERHRPRAQQPDRLGLHGQAEAARPRRGRLRGGAVRAGRGPRRPQAADAQDRRDGRGAAHDAEPQGGDRRGRATGCSSSTPASSTAPATRSTPPWRPARWSARTP